jgi:hypothetical protein
VTSAYFVFSEAHEPHGAIDVEGVVCKVCSDLGTPSSRIGSVVPQEPTPIDVPEPPIEPTEPPVSPSPNPEL